MAEFGQPVRNATSDANEGVVNPPSLKHSARQLATPGQKKAPTAIEEGIGGVGQALGRALQSRLVEETTNINEKRVQAAAIRQGQDHAVNQIDANKKRVGWERGIFGQDIEYRAAQQRAVTNSVNAAYLEQATDLDKYAGEPPESYQSRLQDNLDTMLEPYGEDKETKDLVTHSWSVQSAKLAAKHYENHYAFNQIQQRETFELQTEQHFDMWTVDKSLASSKEELDAINMAQSAFFRKATKPKGMSDIAWRGSVNSQLMKNLREGNIGAFKAAEVNGWIDGLSPKERVPMDKAISAYETKFGNKVDLLYEETRLAADNAKSSDEASALYAQAIQEVDVLESRATGSDKSKKKLTNTKNRINDLAKRGYKAGVKAEKAQTRIDQLKYSHRTTDPSETAGIPKVLDASPKELQDTLDMVLIEDIQRLTGSEEPINAVQANQIILSDVKVAESLAQRLKGKQTTSPLVKTVTEAFIGGFHNIATDSGTMSEDAISAMASIAQFEQNEDTFIRTLGKKNYDKYEIIKRGMAIGQTVDMITKDLDTFSANVGNRDKYSPNWHLGEGESKRDRIQSLVNRWVHQTPTGSSLGQYMEDYDRALTLGFGDKDYAEQYLRKSVLNAGINYKGHAIPNGNRLNSLTSYNFEQLMDSAQVQYGVDKVSAIEPYLMRLTNIKPEEGRVTSLDQISSIEMYVQDGYDGVFIDSQFAQEPEYIPGDVLKRWSNKLKQRKNFQAIEQEVSDNVADKWLKEQQQLQEVTPLAAGF